jgi:hypothetical protein
VKHYEDSDNFDKKKLKQWNQEHKSGGFRCMHCRQFVVINELMGTRNRNHCNICFWSKHVDNKTGDRRSNCHGGMKPIGLTLKHEGSGKIGELMFIHFCLLCTKININRVARDDPESSILDVFNQTETMINTTGIDILHIEDYQVVHEQLYGR